jgi:hypothetical protein
VARIRILGCRHLEGASKTLRARREGAEPGEDGDDLRARLLLGGECPLEPVAKLVIRPLKVRHHKIVLGREVPIQGHLGHARFGDDLIDPHGLEAALIEEAARRLEQALAGRSGLG